MIDLFALLLLFVWQLLISVFLGRLSSAAGLVPLHGSAINPLIFLNFLLVFFALDFLFLFIDPFVGFYEEPLQIQRTDVLKAYGVFLSLASFSTLGIASGLKSNKQIFPSKWLKFSTRATVWFSLLILFLGCVALVPILSAWSSMMQGELTRQIFFSENRVLYIAVALLPIGFSFFATVKGVKSPITYLALALVIAVTFVSGSRGLLLLVGMIMVSVYTFEGGRTSWKWLVIALPGVATGLLLHRFYFREAFRGDSFAGFLNSKGGVFQVFFSTTEISMAEVLSIVVRYGEHVPRAPFEGLLAALMYPFPRQFFPFKPFSGDAAVTAEFSPMRWELTRSEIVITGFGDFYLEFGLIGGAIAAFAIAYLWTRVLVWSLRGKIFAAASLPFLIYWSYLFLRSGIFNAAGSIWAFVTICFSLWFFSRLKL